MNTFLLVVIIPAILILLILATTIFSLFKKRNKVMTLISGVIALIVLPSFYFLIVVLVFGFSLLSQVSSGQINPEKTIVDILGSAGTMGITRDEEIEEPAASNSKLEIKLLKLYAFEGRKNGNSVRECNLTLNYKNLSSENLLISTDSNVNFLYHAVDKDPKIDKQEIPNEPEKYQNLTVTQNAPVAQILPENSIFSIPPNQSLQKILDLTCPKNLLYDFTYYYDTKNFDKITSTNEQPIKIRFDFVQ